MPADTLERPASSGDRENPGGFTHIPALDGVRGLAIVLVLIDHLLWANSSTGSRLFDFLAQVRGATFCGVNLFFALSGFLITGILLDTLNVPHFFRTFYARRSLRIFPLYYGFLILILILTKPLHLIWSGWQIYYLTYTANLAFLRAYSPLDLKFFNINHFWSLQVEEQFYLVWPIVVYRLRRAEKLIPVALITSAAVLLIRIVVVAMRTRPGFDNAYVAYSPTFACADNILFGCCLCALLRTHWRQKVIDFAPLTLGLSAVIMLIAFIVNHGPDWGVSFFIPTVGFTVIDIGCAALICMALQPASRTQRLFQNPTLRFFGKYSYGIYVFHYSLDEQKVPIRLFLETYLHSKALSVLLEALLVAGASVLAAILSYHFYEMPFLKLKKYFTYNRSANPVSSPEKLAQPT